MSIKMVCDICEAVIEKNAMEETRVCGPFWVNNRLIELRYSTYQPNGDVAVEHICSECISKVAHLGFGSKAKFNLEFKDGGKNSIDKSLVEVLVLDIDATFDSPRIRLIDKNNKCVDIPTNKTSVAELIAWLGLNDD